VLTTEQANQIVSPGEREDALAEERAKQARAREREVLRRREESALEQLHELGFRVSLYEPSDWVDPDPLHGIAGGWRSGVCNAIAYAVDGRRKSLSGISAVQALDEARSWLRHQARLKDDAPNRFVLTNEDVPAVHVSQRIVGDKAETQRRRENTVRRVISFQSGIAEVVDAHSDPVGDTDSRASQYRERD
jgi:hypothetical protein